MLIEQIIEFEWRGLGPLDRTCATTTGYFYVKTKTSKENLRVDYYLLSNLGYRTLLFSTKKLRLRLGT